MMSMKPLAMLASEASGRMKVGKSSRFDNFGEVEAVEIYEETTHTMWHRRRGLYIARSRNRLSTLHASCNAISFSIENIII